LVLALGSSAARAEPVLAGLSRVELGVTDLEASMRFYGQLFGGEDWQLSPDGRAWLPVGSAYLVLRQAGAASIRLTGFAVDDFDADPLRDYLRSQGLRPELDGEGLLSVRDGDGIVTALTDRQPPRVALSRHAASGAQQDGIFN